MIDGLGRVVDLAHYSRLTADNLRLRRHLPLAGQLEELSPALADALVQVLRDHRVSTVQSLAKGIGDFVFLVRAHFGPVDGAEGFSATLEVLWSGRRDDPLVRHALRAERLAAAPARFLPSLNQAEDLVAAAPQVLARVVADTGMETAAVFQAPDRAKAELMAAYGPTSRRGFPYPDVDLSDPAIAVVLRDSQLVELTPGLSLQPGLQAVVRRGWGRAVVVPAVAGHVAHGLVVVSRRSADPVAVQELELLQVFGESLGLILRNHALSTRTQRDAEALETAYSVSRAICRSLDLEHTFQQIAVSAAHIVEGSHCLLLELDTETGDLVAVASSDGIADGELVGLRVRFQDAAEALDALKQRRSLAVDDMVWGARVSSQLRRRLDMHSLLFLPMFAQGNLIGSLLIYSAGRRRAYSGDEVEIAEELAEQAAIAIQNARLYRNLARSEERIQSLVQRMGRVREHERQTFANLVHDDIVQSIVGAVYQLQALDRSVDEDAQDMYEEVLGILRQSVKDARRIIWELRPPVLDELGLKQSLEVLVDRINASSGVTRVFVRALEIPDLSLSVSTAVYRIAREALFNAWRHGGGTVVWLSLRRRQGHKDKPVLQLRVEDEGDGFDVTQNRSDDHYGLAMMEEQATLVGGVVAIRSSLGVGTVVEATIPLPDEGGR